MPTIAISLDPQKLPNPDTDIRYALPDLLVARSSGAIADEGYDYVGEDAHLVLFLSAADTTKALAVVREVIAGEDVLGNKLSEAAVVALKESSGYRVVYPLDFKGVFQTNEEKT